MRGQLGARYRRFRPLPPSLRFLPAAIAASAAMVTRGARLDGEVIGGENLVTGSVEFERMSATPGARRRSSTPAMRSVNGRVSATDGVGAGVRLAFACRPGSCRPCHGLDDAELDPDHINIGPDL